LPIQKKGGGEVGAIEHRQAVVESLQLTGQGQFAAIHAAHVVRCVVLAGRRPIEEHELRCFEVFRNACKDVEVITFDELLAKLEYLQQHLQPVPDEVPF